MGLLTCLFGCKNSGNNIENKISLLKEITSRYDPNEGWHDIFLKITSSISTDSSKILTCQGLYKGKVVGLQIELKSNIGPGITDNGELNPQIGFVYNAVQLRSNGEESNNLIKALSYLYEKPTEKAFTKKTNWLTVFSLNKTSVDLSKNNNYKLKIFFDQDEDIYGELFLNINTTVGEVELNEKDQEYRDNIIKILTQ